MPYIDYEHRAVFNQGLDVGPSKPGELNYILTELCLQYLVRQGRTYTTLNEIVGVLESAKLEFYRRAVAAYEDEKIRENGDVYP